MITKESLKEKVKKKKEKEKLKKEITKIKEKRTTIKTTPLVLSDFTEIIKDNTTINEQESLQLRIKEKEDLFLMNYFNENIKPTMVYIYDQDKSFDEYTIEDIIIFSREKPIIRNNITKSQNIKLKKYLDNTILSIDNIYVILNYNKNIKLKYKLNDILSNKFMFFEKKKKSELIYNKK